MCDVWCVMMCVMLVMLYDAVKHLKLVDIPVVLLAVGEHQPGPLVGAEGVRDHGVVHQTLVRHVERVEQLQFTSVAVDDHELKVFFADAAGGLLGLNAHSGRAQAADRVVAHANCEEHDVVFCANGT